MTLGLTVWTVGHSNHGFDAFARLLEQEQIEFLIDVRSFPYSRFAQHFNREHLQKAIGQQANAHRLALVCSEGGPHDCHRRLLVGRVLAEHGAQLRHILPDGAVKVELSVEIGDAACQCSLFGEETPWRSTQSVSHRRRLSASSRG